MTTANYVCPDCRSANVKWRNRRFYDGFLNFWWTWLNNIFAMGPDKNAMLGSSQGGYADQMRAEWEGKQWRGTAEVFWKCPDCKNSGEASRAEMQR